MFLHSFEDHIVAVRGNVEVANVEVGREIRQLVLRPRFQVDQPQVLMPNVSLQEYESLRSRQESQMSRSAS